MPVSQQDLESQLDEAEHEIIEEPQILTPEDLAEPGTTIAKPDGPMPWEHQSIEFYGETLEVRKPTDQALAAFGLASGKYMPQELQNNIVGLFVKQHLSPASLERVYFRLLDPDDAEYTPATLGELMRTIATIDKDAKVAPAK